MSVLTEVKIGLSDIAGFGRDLIAPLNPVLHSSNKIVGENGGIDLDLLEDNDYHALAALTRVCVGAIPALVVFSPGAPDFVRAGIAIGYGVCILEAVVGCLRRDLIETKSIKMSKERRLKI